MNTTELLSLNVRSTLAEWIDRGGLPCVDRDARIVRSEAGVTGIEMGDAGDGEFWRTVTDGEADQLVAAGMLRDAR